MELFNGLLALEYTNLLLVINKFYEETKMTKIKFLQNTTRVSNCVRQPIERKYD